MTKTIEDYKNFAKKHKLTGKHTIMVLNAFQKKKRIEKAKKTNKMKKILFAILLATVCSCTAQKHSQQLPAEFTNKCGDCRDLKK